MVVVEPRLRRGEDGLDDSLTGRVMSDDCRFTIVCR
jgi:hypothetical protein